MKRIEKNLKLKTFEQLLKKELKSKTFEKEYNEELVRLQLAAELIQIRTKQGLTQGVVAKKANMPQSVIARIESGNHSMSLDTLNKIAYVLGKRVQLT
jgi:DNA-binding XRE family transcriptional regulator